MNRSSDVIKCLAGKTLATAESLTGGGIGAVLTAVPGSSAVYKGGIVSYTNEVKMNILGVTPSLLDIHGAVSAPVAEEMAAGVRRLLNSDIAVSVTGLAGPAGDEFSHPVGTVFIGYQDSSHTIVEHHRFEGDREEIRSQTIQAALQLILQYNP